MKHPASWTRPPSPLLWLLVLYFAATTRWGSHVSVPGVPVYVGDVVLALAAVQVARRLRADGLAGGDVLTLLRQAPIALQLWMVVLTWTVARAVVGLPAIIADPVVALRDLAPYAYIVAALIAYLQPAPTDERSRRVIYVVLAVHATWVLGAPRLPGWPWGVTLGGSIPVFTARPDVDSALAGVAIAFTLFDLLVSPVRHKPAGLALRLAFLVVNALVVASVQTRAGMLATLVAIAAVLAAWCISGRKPTGGRLRRPQRVVATLTALLVVGAVATISPPGQRLVQAVTGEDSQALGTVQVRESAWTGVVGYVLADAGRSAVGVGFGPDFMEGTGRAYLLEGSEDDDVRSPHNYLLGTVARLGVAGAFLAVAGLVCSWVIAGRRLLDGDPATLFAALLVLTLPVTAMLGVVLESPFGAIPYFWAVGHLARRTQVRRQDREPAGESPVSTAPPARKTDPPVAPGRLARSTSRQGA